MMTVLTNKLSDGPNCDQFLHTDVEIEAEARRRMVGHKVMGQASGSGHGKTSKPGSETNTRLEDMIVASVSLLLCWIHHHYRHRRGDVMEQGKTQGRRRAISPATPSHDQLRPRDETG